MYQNNYNFNQEVFDTFLPKLGHSEAFENLLAKKESEIIGKNDFELFEEDLAKVFRREDFEVLDENNLITSNEWIIFGHKRIFFQK